MRFQHRLSVSLIVRHGVTQLRYLGTLQQRNSFPRAAACASAIGAALPADVQGGGTILRLVDAMNATHAGRELFSGGRRGLPQITLPAAKPRRGVRQWAAGPSPVHVSGAGALLGRLATTEQGTGGLRPLRQRQDRPGPAAGVGKSKV